MSLDISLEIEVDTGAPEPHKVELYSGNKSFVKEYITTKGFQSSSTHKIHFGLESISKIDSIKIIWPENIQQIITGFNINHNNKISRTLSVKKNPFKSSNINTHLEKFPFKHVENLFEDYDYEKLIPEKALSEEIGVRYFKNKLNFSFVLFFSRSTIARLQANPASPPQANHIILPLDGFSELSKSFPFLSTS